MAIRLNESQKKELRECFNLFDKDQSGTILSNELKQLCSSMSLAVTDADIRDLLNLMDRDGSGSIDFKEFADVMASQFYQQPSESDLHNAFDFFDNDKSGLISEDELFQAMTRFRGGITKADIHRMVAKIDKDTDGRINYKEFIALMSSS